MRWIIEAVRDECDHKWEPIARTNGDIWKECKRCETIIAAPPDECPHCQDVKKGQCPCQCHVHRQKKVKKTKVCTACYGKGWHSQITRERGRGDFIGDPNYDSGDYMRKNPCGRCKGSGKETT